MSLYKGSLSLRLVTRGLFLPPTCFLGSYSNRDDLLLLLNLDVSDRCCQNIVQEWSCVRGVLSAWEKTTRKLWWHQFLQRSRIVLGMCFRASQVCSGGENLLQLLLFICLYEKHNFCYIQLVLMIVHFTHVKCTSILLKPQSINCPMP